MKNKRMLGVVLAVVMAATVILTLAACNKAPKPFDTPTEYDVKSNSLHVAKVDNIPDNFVMGMDSSCVIALEKSGVKYYDFENNEKDVFQILAENGINTIRVRVWNNPFDANGNGYGGGNCDINNAVELGKRATKYGMNLMVDFHYSDFWADPAKQMAPLAWKKMTLEEKGAALYEYTKDCLKQLVEADVRISLVQIGNETNAKMCGETVWKNIAALMNQGSKAIREVCPKALVVTHFANPEKTSNYVSYAKNLEYYGVDYDVFASSYYPYWHGTLDNLSTVLGDIAKKYHKKVMVAETSYAFTTEDTDFSSNTIGEGGGIDKNYPFTVQGQANSVRDVINTVANIENGIGVCYWEGTWISVGTSSWEENSALWEKYGSGWASSYAKVYDPDDAGKYYGGSAVDNQAFFDAQGKPLESLKVFALVRTGNKVTNKADALEDVYLNVDLNSGSMEMPKTVNAVMLDDSKQPVPVTWDIDDAKISEILSSGAAKYDIIGHADGMSVHCYITALEKNYITNYSFEDDAAKTAVPTGWKVTNRKSGELYVADEKNNALSGTKIFHFWGASAESIDFSLEQTVVGAPAGTYKYSISIMGEDETASAMDIYAYVKINGEIVKQQALTLTGWGADQWHTALIDGIEYNGTDEIVVGIYVKCDGAGVWAKIDDALLNFVSPLA